MPEATPVHEASALQDDLRRAGIEPFAWVVNQSFAATATHDPMLLARGAREGVYIDEVRTSLARRIAIVAWQAEPSPGSGDCLHAPPGAPHGDSHESVASRGTDLSRVNLARAAGRPPDRERSAV